jgi:hypothetical protein
MKKELSYGLMIISFALSGVVLSFHTVLGILLIICLLARNILDYEQEETDER